MTQHRRPSGPLFVLRLRAVGPHPIHSLRWLLKIALRRGLRCVSVVEVTDENEEATHANEHQAKTCDLA